MSPLQLPLNLPPELEFRIAKTADEYTEALKILYECYIEKGYTSENDDKIRVTPYHLLPTTTVILALWNQEIIGTLSLIRDNPIGLPTDHIFDLSFIRKNHNTLCEVSALGIKKSHRGKSGEILHPLIRFMWNYSLNYFGIDYFVIAVNPSMYQLYESVYLFEKIKNTTHNEQYEFANNNPAVGQYTNVKNSFAQFREHYKNTDLPNNLYEFLSKAPLNNEKFPIRKFYTHLDAPIQPNWLEHFSKYVPNFKDQDNLQNKIANSYGYRNRFEFNKTGVAKGFRVPVSFKVHNQKNARITNISTTGLNLISDNSLTTERSVILECQISEGLTAEVVAIPKWQQNSDNSQNQKNYGLQIINYSKEWEEMLQTTMEEFKIAA